MSSTSTEIEALLDSHLLDAQPSRDELVATVLASPPPSDAARPYYEGLRMLAGRTPELALIALRLTLAGRHADDATVVRLRNLLQRVREGGEAGERARKEYGSLLQER